MNGKRILVVDDDPELRRLLSEFLARHGYDVFLASDTRTLDQLVERHAPHLVVLDLMLPGESGLDACRRLRRAHESLAIIMLTARDTPVDRVVGLELGADDYVGKPFDPRELVARIEAVLRRQGSPAAAPDADAGRTRFGPFELDHARRELVRGAEAIALSSGEYALLNVFVRNAGRPLRRERLLELVHGEEPAGFDRAIDVQVFRLRRIVEENPAKPRYIQTIWGVGYVFVPDGTPRGRR